MKLSACYLEIVPPPAAIPAFWMQPLLLEGGQAGSQEGFRFTSFFSSNFDSNLQARLTDLGRLSFSSTSALLAGPPRSGKTTLLFQYAHNHLLDHPDDTVLVITKRQRLEGSPPLLPQGVTKTSPAYERLQIRYLENDHELRKFFACIHLLRSLPSLLIVDNFADFFLEKRVGDHGPPARSREQAFVKTLALLHDACCFVRQSKQTPCIVLLSDTNVGDMPRNLYLYQRWIPLLIKIKAGDGNTFTASATDSASGVDVCASYSLTSTSLSLDHIDGRQKNEQETAVCHAADPTQSLRF